MLINARLNASFATFEPCECMQLVKCTRRVAVAVVSLSHRHGQAEQWPKGGLIEPVATRQKTTISIRYRPEVKR